VSVTDKQGGSIDGLTSDDFIVRDDGKPRQVHVDPAGVYRSGVSAVIVVQTTEASHSALLKIRRTGSMIEGYITGEDGEAAVISANDEIKTLQSFTTDGLKVRDVFENLRAGSSTKGRVLDGVAEGLQMLEKKTLDRRRLMVVISESRDRGSKAHVEDIVSRAARANVTIYTVTFSAYTTAFTTKASDLPTPRTSGGILAIALEISRLAKQNIGEALSQYTGGRHVSFNTVRALERDFTAIGKEIHSQYQLTFPPSADNEPSYHKLSIEIKNRPEARVRARPGYWTTGREDDRPNGAASPR
jgi:VWFA-related protein